MYTNVKLKLNKVRNKANIVFCIIIFTFKSIINTQTHNIVYDNFNFYQFVIRKLYIPVVNQHIVCD